MLCIHDAYKSTTDKYKFSCKKGHEFYKQYRYTDGCPECKNLEHIRELASEKGFELLSDRYIGNPKDFVYKYRCEYGHEFETTLTKLRICPVCREIGFPCVCYECGKEFIGATPKSKYCSEKCRRGPEVTERNIESDILIERQAWELDRKIEESKLRIEQWYEYWEGQVFVSFSGGKDSTVLLHLVRELFPEVPAVFIDTGLEYPEIRDFVRKFDNVVWLRPVIPFHKVIEKYGYPVVSKLQASFIRSIQNPTENNKDTIRLHLTGFNKDGQYRPSYKLADKWHELAYSDIKVSDRCCYVLKKEPLKRYVKETGRVPIIGTMAEDSFIRRSAYLKTGCNSFTNTRNPKSAPISFWKREDIWGYIKKFELEYCSIYETVKNTGCMFCMFGVHLEKEPNRFQMMKKTHPKYYDYCINKLGCGKVLDFIGVPY